MMHPLFIFEIRNELGEGILWDWRSQEALWIDIEGRSFWRWRMDAIPQSYPLPQRPGSFGLTPMSGEYIGAFEQGFAHFVPATGAMEMRAPILSDHAHIRMNDGRVDPQGRFWAGSMAEETGLPLGSLWRYEGNGQASPFLHDIRIPNSLAWSLDGRRMYFADSPELAIRYYDFSNQPNEVPHLLAQTPDGVYPDGSCTDAQDRLWNAQWGGSEVVCYNFDGSVAHRLKLPVSQPTCVAFGGPDMKWLLVTSARVGLTSEQLALEPLAGALLVYDLGILGRKEEICTQL